MSGTVRAICISALAGEQMWQVAEARAIAGAGLKGDRYVTGDGSFSQGKVGNRQVTLINGIFFNNSGYTYEESRRNIIVEGIETMYLIGREFRINGVLMRGVKYCDPCSRPSKLANKNHDFREVFFDRGGLVADVLEGGIIKVGDLIIPPPGRAYQFRR